MESRNKFESSAVINLFHHTGINAPLSLKADLGENQLLAILQDDGSVEMDGKLYDNIDVAMGATAPSPQSASNAWRFWSWYNEERRVWSPLENLRTSQSVNSSINDQSVTTNLPISIAPLDYPKGQGKIGLTICPGKSSNTVGGRARELTQDLQALAAWGAVTIISLVETHEFTMLGVPDFKDQVKASNMIWLHFPIQDLQTPNEEFEAKWRQVGPLLHRQLMIGSSIILHCRNGYSRTGLVAARLLIEAGMTPTQAIHAVQDSQPKAIETYPQEHYLLSRSWCQEPVLAKGA